MTTAERVEQNEGYREHKYLDTEGVETIGIGFNLEQGFSLEESRWILNHRLGKLETELTLRVQCFKDLPEIIQSVLIEMAYNLGVNGLLKFRKMFHQLSIDHYQSAAEEMLDSKWSKQVGNRAKRLSKLVRNA